MNAHARTNATPEGQFTLRGDGRDAPHAQDAVASALERLGYDESARFAVRLALEEALTNAVRHGSGNQPDKRIEFIYRVDDSTVRIDIIDEGPGFDPDSVPDPTAEENLEIPAGRGLVLMRAFMTDVEFPPPGNRVTMTYRRPPRN
jgi:serine/threonine-protein kinase RsbW